MCLLFLHFCDGGAGTLALALNHYSSQRKQEESWCIDPELIYSFKFIQTFRSNLKELHYYLQTLQLFVCHCVLLVWVSVAESEADYRKQ